MNIEQVLQKAITEYISSLRRCNVKEEVLRRNKAVLNDFLSTKIDSIKKDLKCLKICLYGFVLVVVGNFLFNVLRML